MEMDTKSELFYVTRFVPGSRKKCQPHFLKGNEVVFGRNLNAQISILSTSISRRHAVLKKTENSWSIQDEKSLNGVWVNNERLEPFQAKELSVGDVIHLGDPTDTEYIYKFFSAPDTKENSPPSPPCKIAKEDPIQMQQKAEMEERLQSLQQQLEEKQNAERKLQERLKAQEKEHQEFLAQERERILAEKIKSENQLKQELQEQYQIEEKKLRNSLQSHRLSLIVEKERVEQELRQKLTQEMEESLRKEQHRLNQELESSALKAQVLEQQLATSKFERDQSRENVLHHIGDLMETELTCSICVELFVQACTLGCSHTFCRHCITQWKRKKKECPVCRAKIKSEARALVLDNFIEKMVENLSPDMKAQRMNLLKERGAAPSTSTANQPTQATPQVANLAPANPVPAPPRFGNVIPQNNLLSQGTMQAIFRAIRNYPNSTVRLVPAAAAAGPQMRQPNVANAQPGGLTVPRQPVHLPPPQIIPGTVASTSGANDTIRDSIESVVNQTDIQRAPAVVSGSSMDTIIDSIENVVNQVEVYTTSEEDLTTTSSSASENSSAASSASNLTTSDSSSHFSTSSGNSARSSESSRSASMGSDRQTPIVISDSESSESEEENSYSDSENDDDYGPRRAGGAYYGGYGRCYRCGERGHWAPGCRNR